EALRAAVRLRAELDAAVRAAVDEHVRPAVGRADDGQRDLADRRALEVTRARDLGGERDVAPARAPEDPLLLAPVDLGVGVHPVGDPAHALRRPRALRGAIEVVEGFHFFAERPSTLVCRHPRSYRPPAPQPRMVR